MMRRLSLVASLTLALAASSAAAQITKAPAPKETSQVKVETYAKGLANPWAFQFLPDGRMIVTEVRGTMRFVAKNGGVSAPLKGVPAVMSSGQGGLLDIALAPDFAASGRIYFTYSEPRGNVRSGTAVARAKLVTDGAASRLDDVRVIFRQKPDYGDSYHFGSRISFARDGSLFVTLGERNTGRDGAKRVRELAQDASNHLGKIVRLTVDGAAHPATPKLPGWAAENWSIGHRNPQSAAIHPVTGKLWTVEHGPRGGDEINIPEAGKNYGWPVITYGRDYTGTKVGVGSEKAGLEQPVYYWDPSIAPSGMAFYTGDLFSGWKGSLLVGALAGSHLARLVLDGEKVVAEERLLASEGERIRDVRQGPDGAIYVATDNHRGRILRVVPAQPSR